MGYNVEVFSRQYPGVVFFVQNLAYYAGLFAIYGSITDRRDFWRSTCDAHLGLATIQWCNVFGSDREDMHWKKTATEPQAREAFRCKVLSQTGFTQAQWETYHTEMLEFRGKFVAHLDLCSPFIGPIPYFDPALRVAYAYHDWVKELIRPVYLSLPTLKSRYEQWEAEARAATSAKQEIGADR